MKERIAGEWKYEQSDVQSFSGRREEGEQAIVTNNRPETWLLILRWVWPKIFSVKTRSQACRWLCFALLRRIGLKSNPKPGFQSTQNRVSGKLELTSSRGRAPPVSNIFFTLPIVRYKRTKSPPPGMITMTVNISIWVIVPNNHVEWKSMLHLCITRSNVTNLHCGVPS